MRLLGPDGLCSGRNLAKRVRTLKYVRGGPSFIRQALNMSLAVERRSAYSERNKVLLKALGRVQLLILPLLDNSESIYTGEHSNMQLLSALASG